MDILKGNRVAGEVNPFFQFVSPDEADQRVPVAFFVLNKVGDIAAIFVRAGQRDKVFWLSGTPDYAGRGNSIHRVDAAVSSGAKDRLKRKARAVRRVQSESNEIFNFIVVDAFLEGCDEGDEDLVLVQNLQRVELFLSERCAPQVLVGTFFEAVELEVHLDLAPVLVEELLKLLIFEDSTSVGVEQDSCDWTFGEFLDQLFEVAPKGRFATTEHHHADLASLAFDHGVNGMEKLGEAWLFALGGGGSGFKRGRIASRALVVAVLGEVEQEDARVLAVASRKSFLVSVRESGEVVGSVWCHSKGRGLPAGTGSPNLGVFFIEAFGLAVLVAPAAHPD